MKLYGETVSLFCTRVLLAARAKGLALAIDPLPGGSVGAPAFKAINPIGKMPVLEHNGEYLAESEVILEYLEETQPGKPLLPVAAMDRARCRLLSRIVDLYIMPPATGFYRNMNPERRKGAEVELARLEYRQALGYFEHYMGNGPYAWADSITLADCALAPLVDVMAGTILPLFELPNPVDDMPKLGPWWRRIQSDELFGPMLRQYRIDFRAFMQTQA